MNDKTMVVFAGPNGSGKSTVVKNTLANGSVPRDFICPDNLEGVEFYDAAQKAEELRFLKLAREESFTFETVLSTERKLRFIQAAKVLGYKVQVVYVTTNDPKINIERVKSRVAQGGHDVPEDKILSRYEKSMDLMFDVMCAADETFFYDNSSEKPKMVATKFSWLAFVEEAPEWLETHVLAKARAHHMEIATLTHY